MKSEVQNFTALAIDDSPEASQLLEGIITNYVPEITTFYASTNFRDAVEFLRTNKVDILFLDMEIGELSGIGFLKTVELSQDIAIIVVSGFSNYAIEAIKYSVFDYLLKPISPIMVRETINRLITSRSSEIIKEGAGTKVAKNYLLLNRHDKCSVVNIDDICYLNANGPYTTFVLNNEQRIMSSKAIGHFEEILIPEYSKFIRPHRSYIINSSEIREIVKTEEGEGELIFNNNNKIFLSRDFKNSLIKVLEGS